MPRRKPSKNVQTVLAILNDEVNRDIRAALKRLAPRYSMTWVYQDRQGTLFPRVGPRIRKKDLAEAYGMEERHYDIKHVAEGHSVVMVELVESYRMSGGKSVQDQVLRTPLVLVLEMRAGKITKGRHYCDPRLSYKNLSEGQVAVAFR